MRKTSDFDLFIVGVVLSALALISVTFFMTGSIQYYAIKQTLVMLGFLVIYCAINIYEINKILFQRLSIYFGILFFIFALNHPREYTGAFMGSLRNTAQSTLLTNNWSGEFVDANLILRILNRPEIEEASCLVMHIQDEEGDLNSRWLNALNSRSPITEKCFSIFWNSTSLTKDEILSRAADLYPGLKIIFR
jgi:hypothetical protein